MNMQINVEYMCKCGNVSSIDGGTSDRNNGIANCINGSNNFSMIVYDRCRVICLNCGKDMKLRVYRKEVKTETKVITISETQE